MTRNQLRKKCKREKIKGYQFLWAGEITAFLGLLIILVMLFLTYQNMLSFYTATPFLIIAFVLAVTGSLLYMIGEGLALHALKSRANIDPRRPFAKTKRQTHFTLENQDGKSKKVNDATIHRYLETMFASPDQFIVLSAPTTSGNIRFMQACLQGESVDLQLGLEEDIGNQLVHKICSKEECRLLFLAFYHGTFQFNRFEYQAVLF